jgi:hypothetical protein
MTVLERLITTVLTYLNAAGYYKSAEEIQNAINVAQLDLYKRLRGNMAQYAPGRPLAAVNPDQTTVSTDALAELYYPIESLPFGGGQVTVFSASLAQNSKAIDIVLSLEVSYNNAPTQFYPVNIVPNNQYLMLKNNPVVPPIESRPIGRSIALLTYEVLPIVNANTFRAQVITLPSPAQFTFVDNGNPIPTIVAAGPFSWTEDKLDNLVYGTVANLGFNLSNGVLVQSGNGMNDKIL